jgi:DNA-3-methyladenine glycosylase
MPTLPDCSLPATTLAPRLLGMLLRHGEVVVRITEVEAYFWPGDSACHARAGRTARNAPMWERGGLAYIYPCYGMHHLLNVTCDVEGVAAAVLIRSAEPVEGHAVIEARRRRPLRPNALAGPGKVTQALGVDASWRGHDLLAPGGLELLPGPPPSSILTGPRIGIDYALPEHIALPLRFADGGSAWVSHRRGLR